MRKKEQKEALCKKRGSFITKMKKKGKESRDKKRNGNYWEKKRITEKKWNSPFEQNGILLATQWEWDYWQEAGKIKHEGILITCS